MSRLARGMDPLLVHPQPTSTLALFRIAFGLVVTGWTATLGLDLFAFIGPAGVLPEPGSRPGAWGVLALSTSPPMTVALYVATLAGALALPSATAPAWPGSWCSSVSCRSSAPTR